LKVSEKGAVSVYGVGRFPVTLFERHMVNRLARGDRDQLIGVVGRSKHFAIAARLAPK
jgi:hypothetical protein